MDLFNINYILGLANREIFNENFEYLENASQTALNLLDSILLICEDKTMEEIYTSLDLDMDGLISQSDLFYWLNRKRNFLEHQIQNNVQFQQQLYSSITDFIYVFDLNRDCHIGWEEFVMVVENMAPSLKNY